MRLLLSVFVLVLQILVAQATEIYVSQEGNDKASGSVKEPVQSFEKALEISRKFNGAKTIFLTEGTHFLRETIQLDGRDQGLTLHGNYKATLSGGELVENWEVLENGFWRAKVPVEGSPRELFINGKRATRARFPNKGWHRIEKSLPDRRSGFSFNQGDIENDLEPSEGLELIFLHDWSISRIPVASIDHCERVLKVEFPIGCEAPHYAIDHFEKHPRYALEGSLALLDEPGEWAIKDGHVYYNPIEGENIKKTEFIFPKLTKLLEIAPGKDGKQPNSIWIFRVNFAHCRWDLPIEGYASGQASVHEWRDGTGKKGRKFIPAAVEVRDAHRVHFQSTKFSQLGGSGLWFRGNSESCTLIYGEFSDISANAINIGEQSTPKVPVNIDVNQSLISNTGIQYFGSVGIWIGMATNCSVFMSEIRNLPYTGISVGWRWSPTPSPCKGHHISGNHIHQVLQVLSDGGGVYTLGLQPKTIISKNYIHDVPLNLGRAQSNGIFLDQGSTEIHLIDNIINNVAKSPIRFHQAGTNWIFESYLGTGTDIPAFTYNQTDSKDIVKVNNKVFDSKSPEIQKAGAEWLKDFDLGIKK